MEARVKNSRQQGGIQKKDLIFNYQPATQVIQPRVLFILISLILLAFFS